MLCHLYESSQNTKTLTETESRLVLREVREETDHRRACGNSGGGGDGYVDRLDRRDVSCIYVKTHQIVPFKFCHSLNAIYIYF